MPTLASIPTLPSNGLISVSSFKRSLTTGINLARISFSPSSSISIGTHAASLSSKPAKKIPIKSTKGPSIPSASNQTHIRLAEAPKRVLISVASSTPSSQLSFSGVPSSHPPTSIIPFPLAS